MGARGRSTARIHELPARLAEGEEVTPPAVLARRRLEPSCRDPPEGLFGPAARGLHLAGSSRRLLPRLEVQVREREVLRPLPPHLDAGQRVQIELQPYGHVVVGGPAT